MSNEQNSGDKFREHYDAMSESDRKVLDDGLKATLKGMKRLGHETSMELMFHRLADTALAKYQEYMAKQTNLETSDDTPESIGWEAWAEYQYVDMIVNPWTEWVGEQATRIAEEAVEYGHTLTLSDGLATEAK